MFDTSWLIIRVCALGKHKVTLGSLMVNKNGLINLVPTTGKQRVHE